MKRIGLAAVAVALMSSGALASDLNGSLKDSPFRDVNKIDFSGAYVGVGAGGQFVSAEIGSFDGVGADGVVGEAIVGFDVRRRNFVFGPRVIGAIGNVNTTIGNNDLVNIDAYLNLGGRAGVVFNRTLIYIHGGYEMVWASSDSPAIDAALDDADLNAATVGVGVEAVLGGNLSLTLEATYVSGLDDAEDVEGGRGVARLNYRF